MDDAQFVAALAKELTSRIGPERYEIWFASQATMHLEAGRLTVRAATTFARDWLRRHFASDLAACGQSITGQPIAVEFDVATSTCPRVSQAGETTQQCGDAPKSRSPSCKSTNPQSAIAPAPRLAPVERSELRAARVLPTFAQFAVGPSNEYALRSAELTAHGRQQASPLLFCGPTGVGKTHLLRAIQAEYCRRHPRSSAVYLTSEQFTTSFVEAIRGSGLPSFRQKCRGAQMLLIDDLQFFVGKQRTIEELHHTIDTLLASGRQLVLATDRSLALLRGLGPELSSRLAGGLTCEIGPPEFSTRLAVLRLLRGELAMDACEDVLKLVAAQITTGARELRGALHRLQAISGAYERQISRELAETVLADMARQSTPVVRLADVEQAVCSVFGVEAKSLRSDRKGRTQAEPRMLAMWLARKYTRSPWSEIGEFFGRRSHSTVIAAHRRVEKLITSQAVIGVGSEPCNVEEAIRRLEVAIRTA
jgi:chromosomal replication initiator protein